MTSHPSRLAFVIATLMAMAAVRAGAQDTPRQLFEAGRYQEAIDKSAGDGSPAALYLKGLSYLKLNQLAAAKDAFGQVGGDEAWHAVGQSAVALADNNRDALIKFYGAEKGRAFKYAQAYEVCEYGRQPSVEDLIKLMPF